MVLTTNIHWLNVDAKEAEVILTDDIYQVVCFACPYDANREYNLLYAMDANNIYKSGEKFYLERQSDT